MTLQVAAQTKIHINFNILVKYNNILVNFDHPDGSTSWGYIGYYSLVKFDILDGSTCFGLKYYNILVNFDHPDGSISWSYTFLYFS